MQFNKLWAIFKVYLELGKKIYLEIDKKRGRYESLTPAS